MIRVLKTFRLYDTVIALCFLAGCATRQIDNVSPCDITIPFQQLGHLSGISDVAAIVAYPDMTGWSDEQKFDFESMCENKITETATFIRKNLPFIRIHHIRSLDLVVKHGKVSPRTVLRCNAVLILQPDRSGKCFMTSLYYLDRDGGMQLCCQGGDPISVFAGYKKELCEIREIVLPVIWPEASLCSSMLSSRHNRLLVWKYFLQKYGKNAVKIYPVLDEYSDDLPNDEMLPPSFKSSKDQKNDLSENDIAYIAVLAVTDIMDNNFDRAASTFHRLYKICPIPRFNNAAKISEFLAEVTYQRHKRVKSALKAKDKISIE